VLVMLFLVSRQRGINFLLFCGGARPLFDVLE